MKMTSRKILIEDIKFHISSKKFIFVFLILILLNLYAGIIISANATYIDSFITSFQMPYYLSFFFGIIFINSYIVITDFDSNNARIIRYKSKRVYIKELLKSVFWNNIVVYLISLLMLTIVVNLFNTNGFEIHNYYGYNVSNLVYFIYTILKIPFLILIMTLINTLVYKFANMIALLLFNAYIMISFFNNQVNHISTLSDLKFNLTNLMTPNIYNTFGYEAAFFMLYTSTVLLILYIIYVLVTKRKNTFIKQKYIMISDFKHILKKKKLLIAYFIIIAALYIFSNYVLKIKSIEKLYYIFGGNISNENFNIIKLSALIFNLLFYSILTIELFIKDIKYNPEILFLRTSFNKWLISKIKNIILITISIKIISYILIYFTSLWQFSLISLIMFAIKDILFIVSTDLIIILIFSLLKINYIYFIVGLLFILLYLMFSLYDIVSIHSIIYILIIILTIILLCSLNKVSKEFKYKLFEGL